MHGEVRLQFGGQGAAFSRVAQPPQDQPGRRGAAGLPADRAAPVQRRGGGDRDGPARPEGRGLPRRRHRGAAAVLQPDLTPARPGHLPCADARVRHTGPAQRHPGERSTWDSIRTGLGRAGGAVLRPGYLAVLLAEPGEVTPDRLFVRDGRLPYSQGPGQQPRNLTGIRLHAAASRGAQGTRRLAPQGHPGAAQPLAARRCWRRRRTRSRRLPTGRSRWPRHGSPPTSPSWTGGGSCRRSRLSSPSSPTSGQAQWAASRARSDEIVSARAMRREQADALGELMADEVFD